LAKALTIGYCRSGDNQAWSNSQFKMVKLSIGLCCTPLPPALPDLTKIPLPKFITPISDSFLTDGNASCCQQSFDVTEAKCKSVIKSHSVTYYLRWIAISGINIGVFNALIIAFFSVRSIT